MGMLIVVLMSRRQRGWSELSGEGALHWWSKLYTFQLLIRTIMDRVVLLSAVLCGSFVEKIVSFNDVVAHPLWRIVRLLGTARLTGLKQAYKCATNVALKRWCIEIKEEARNLDDDLETGLEAEKIRSLQRCLC